MAAGAVITIRVRPRWWLGVYINTLLFACSVFGTQPDPERIGYWVARGIRIDVVFDKEAA